MTVPFFQVDAFTDALFGGNPAAVCVLDRWLDDSILLNIAKKNWLPETAFIVPETRGADFRLRWFTPDLEMDLCGHATLATAHVIFEHLQFKKDKVVFASKSGELMVSRSGDFLQLDFPSRMPVPAPLPEVFARGFGVVPKEVYKARDYVLVYDNERTIREIKPDQAILDTFHLGVGGIIITAKGDDVDFVSRYFQTQATIFEDPVTGSAHCSLIPFWSQRLGKKKMHALQVSERLGKLHCEDCGDRVLIAGKAKTYLEGTIHLPL